MEKISKDKRENLNLVTVSVAEGRTWDVSVEVSREKEVEGKSSRLVSKPLGTDNIKPTNLVILNCVFEIR